MKLPNFLASDDLLRLKTAMGIPREKLGDVRATTIVRFGASREEIRQLAEEGLEVDKDAVVSLPDGTLSYKDRRVLLYIRDVSQYGGNYSDPRFHFADCTTLRQMRDNLRFGRFVIASRDDGLFRLHYLESGHRMDKRLDACQNCLDRLNYLGFRIGMRSDARRTAVQGFSIAVFFQAYPKTLHHATPKHTDLTAPTNDYSHDFRKISSQYREKLNWICEQCGMSLADLALRRYLDVHHINGLKNENQESNLKALCLHCHAHQPSHGHVTASQRYKEFEPSWQRWQRFNK